MERERDWEWERKKERERWGADSVWQQWNAPSLQPVARPMCCCSFSILNIQNLLYYCTFGNKHYTPTKKDMISNKLVMEDEKSEKWSLDLKWIYNTSSNIFKTINVSAAFKKNSSNNPSKGTSTFSSVAKNNPDNLQQLKLST